MRRLIRLSRPALRPSLQRRPAVRNIPTTGPRLGAVSRALPRANAESGALQEVRSPARFWGLLALVVTSAVWIAGLSIGYQTALTAQLVFGLLLAVIGLLSPAAGILGIAIFSAVDSVAAEYLYTGGVLRFNTLNYWLLVVMALHLPFLLRLRDLSSRLLQLFLLLIAAELIFSVDLAEGAQDVLNVATTFGIVVYFARSLKDPASLYWVGLVTGALAALGGLVFFLQYDSLPYANPNNWSYFQLTALFAICISFHYARVLNKSRLLLLFLAVVNFAWVFLSASRGSLLIAVLVIVYLFLSTRSITWSSLMLAFAILVGLWVSTQFVEQQLYTVSRIELLFDNTRTERERTSQRSALAAAGIELFLDYPLGIGTGSFRQVTERTAALTSSRPAHSAWIKTLAENGVPGILLLAGFVLSFAIVALRRRGTGLVLFGFFITAVFTAAFVAKEFQGKSLWFLAAAGIVLLNAQQVQEALEKKLRPAIVDYHRRLREVRFGPRR